MAGTSSAMTDNVLGLILAGGLARRMGGGDKPLLKIDGETLLDRTLARFAPDGRASCRERVSSPV